MQKISFIVNTGKIEKAEKASEIRVNHNICYCLSQGFTLFKIELNKSHFHSKEMLAAKIYVDNTNTSKRITKIIIKVMRRLKIFNGDFEVTKELKEENFKGVDGSQKDVFQVSCSLPTALTITHKSDVCSLCYFVSVEAYYGQEMQLAEHEFVILPDDGVMMNLDENEDDSDRDEDFRELTAGMINWKRCTSQVEY